MLNPEAISKTELLALLAEKEQALARQVSLLAEKEQTLAIQVSLLADKEQTLISVTQTLESHRQQLREQDIALQLKDQAIADLTRERDEYKLAYDKLILQRFWKRRERYLGNPDQLRLDFDDTPEAEDAALGLAAAIEDLEQTIPEHKRRRPRRKGDQKFPEHLERYYVTRELEESLRICPEHGLRQPLPENTWDEVESLELERPRLRVKVTRFVKYACEKQPQCGIASPERPTGIVEGCRYDSSIAAEIITGKYAYHLPCYRLQDYFTGFGWTPSRSTQCNILAGAYSVVTSLLEHYKQILHTDGGVGCDDTGLTLLYPDTLPDFDLNDPKQRRMHEVFSDALAKDAPSIHAKMWAYRGVNVKLNLFDFTVSRHRDGPELFFADYAGYLIGDCWHGFESIATASEGRILRVACNAHARRKVENSNAYPADRDTWLTWYQQLYDIEDRGKLLTAEERLALRQREAKPLWDKMEQWLQDVDHRLVNQILPKSDFGLALNYVRNHWVELRRYLENGMLPIDNNDTEQLMRQVALGRKNWLFAGSVAGGERSAGFLSLASSAIRNDLDVWTYVKDVLDQLLAGSTDYDALLPWNWGAAHPESIRQYRAEERRDQATRKRLRRERRRSQAGT